MYGDRISKGLLLTVWLVALVCLVLPVTAWADSGTEDMKCSKCHPNDVIEWEEHPHAHVAGAATATVDKVCETCHGEYVPEHTAEGVLSVQQVINTEKQLSQVSELSNRARLLAIGLEEAKRDNRSLMAMSVVGLGFGLGIGVVLGAIGVFFLGRLAQGRARK